MGVGCWDLVGVNLLMFGGGDLTVSGGVLFPHEAVLHPCACVGTENRLYSDTLTKP